VPEPQSMSNEDRATSRSRCGRGSGRARTINRPLPAEALTLPCVTALTALQLSTSVIVCEPYPMRGIPHLCPWPALMSKSRNGGL